MNSSMEEIETIGSLKESMNYIKDYLEKIDSKLTRLTENSYNYEYRIKTLEEWRLSQEEKKEASQTWWGSIWGRLIGGMLLIGVGALIEWIRYLPPPN